MVSRRTVLKWGGGAGLLTLSGALGACTRPAPAGTDPSGLLLHPGFTSRIIARANDPVAGNQFRAFPDGAATFVDAAVPGGWYLTVNHELPGGGGVTSIRFAPDGTIVSSQEILAGTLLNCAGGATPWGTWLSCEETEQGRVWECDPTGQEGPKVRPAMGLFVHEAAAAAQDGRLYLTEDRPDGGFYRFTPAVAGDLSAGLLEIATGAGQDPGPITWVAVPDPLAHVQQCRKQVPGSIEFSGGEGIATDGNDVWFTTKGNNRVWRYDLATSQLEIHYQAGRPSELAGVDNLWIDKLSGGLLVAEDGDDMQVILLRPDGTLDALVTIPDHEGSEVTGPCFSPDGQRLYFSSQRGWNRQGLPLGVTYEVTGPFDQLLGRH
jgi:sugar lactone lactonase YvrE